MRSVALIAALACATAAHADGARESRYGPAPERAPVPIHGQGPGYTGVGYGGQMLGWTGKREAVAPEVQVQPVQQPWWARQQQAAPQPTPRDAAQPRAQAAPVEQAHAPPARALPQALYADPPAPPAPAQAAYAAPSPSEPRALPPGQLGARTYSVGRQFGMAPDPIPSAGPPRMVLISAPPAGEQDQDPPDDGPTASGTAKKDSDQ